MAKLGKHIYPQVFDIENQIDYNYAIFPDSFTFGGPTGGTGAGTSSFYFDYSSITNWSNVRDILTASCTFIINQIDILYQASGGLTAFPGFTYSVKEALSKNFLLPKIERNLIHTETEQRGFAEELYLCNEQVHKYNSLSNSVDFIVTSDNVTVQTYLNNAINFTVPGSIGGSGGSGSVASVNGQVGNVILGLNELDDVNTSGISTNHIITYNGVNWVTELRPPLTINPLSQNYLNYNSYTGELFMENLAITDVTVNNSATSSSIWFSNPINTVSHQEGDTIIFTNTPFDTEVYIHNGGTSISSLDYTRIKSGAASEAFTRSLFSGNSPISYNSLTGAIGITQSGTQSNGFLSQIDFNLFNNKVDSVNGQSGNITLSTSNITEGANLYYTNTRVRNAISGGNGINYNPTTGLIESINNYVTSINGKTGSVILSINDLNDINVNGATNGYVLTYDGVTWSAATSVNSINGQSGNLTLSSTDINEGTNLYYTDIRARNSISGGIGINYNPTTGIIESTNSITVLSVNGQTGSVVLTLNDLNDINITGATNGYTLVYDGFTWSGATSVNSINGQFGNVTLSSTDINEGTKLYYTNTRARNSISGGTGINYNPTTGIIESISNGVTSVNGKNGSVILSINDLNDINTLGAINGYTLVYDGFTWSGATSVNSINGQFGNVTITTSGINEGTNLYYTDARARNSVLGGTGINYNVSTGEFSFGADNIVGRGLTSINGTTIETSIIPNSGLSFSNSSIDLLIGNGIKNTLGVIEANINDLSINSISELWSANKIYTELQALISGTSVVTSVNNKFGTVTINSDDISEGVTNLYFTQSLSRNSIGVSASSSSYLSYDNNTGLFDMKPLSITNVTVDTTATASSTYFSNNYTGSEYQEGDTIVMSAIPTGTEIYMHNGGTYGTPVDFIKIQSPHITDNYVKSLLSNSLPITYNQNTGVIGINQSSNNTDGYLSSVDWNTFNNKISYTNTLSRNALSAITPISYDALTGTFSIQKSTITTSGYLDSVDFIKFENKIENINGFTGASVSLSITDLTDINTTTTPPIVNDLLKWDGTNWIPSSPIKRTWAWGSSRDSSNVTNSYLNQYDGIPTNQSPLIAFMNCKIKYMSLSTNTNGNWIAEARINGISSATMSVVGISSTYSAFNVSVNAGDKISFYCNGSNIDKPNIQILLEEI